MFKLGLCAPKEHQVNVTGIFAQIVFVLRQAISGQELELNLISNKTVSTSCRSGVLDGRSRTAF